MGNTINSEELKRIGEEINNLKTSEKVEEKEIISLKGLLKGISVSEADVKEAKKSLFKISS